MLLDKIVKAGDVGSNITFAKNAIEFVKIRNLDDETLEVGLGVLLVRISNLLGIKEAISDLNKQDISKLLDTKFKNISLEEINYAFELERFGSLDPKSQHFQLFNAEYVSEVLNKYKKWLSKIRFDNNLKLSKEQETKELTQEEKDLIVYQGVINCFDAFVSNGKIMQDYVSHIYDHLTELNLIQNTDKEKKDKYKIAKKNLYDKASAKIFELTNLRENEKTLVVIETKKMLLKDYFARLHAKGKHIKEFLD